MVICLTNYLSLHGITSFLSVRGIYLGTVKVTLTIFSWKDLGTVMFRSLILYLRDKHIFFKKN